MKRAREAGLRSRAAFKLEEIQRAERILRPGMTVVDLGAAPGGWSQYAAKVLHGKGRVIALDLLPMDELPGVEFIEGDFSDDQVLATLLERLGGEQPPACNVRYGPQHDRHRGRRSRSLDASG